MDSYRLVHSYIFTSKSPLQICVKEMSLPATFQKWGKFKIIFRSNVSCYKVNLKQHAMLHLYISILKLHYD